MFTPKGEKSMWRILYNAVVMMPVNKVISFQELEDIVGFDLRKNRTAIYKARVKLAKNNKRYLVSEHNEGYRIVEGTDILNHAESRHEKANTQIKLANFEASNLDTSKMSPDEKQRLSSFLAWNGSIIQVLSQGIKNVSKANQVASIATNYAEEQLDSIQKTLEKYMKETDDIKKKLDYSSNDST